VTTQVSNRVIQQSGDPESKHVGVNLGFETCPNLNLGGSMVWNPGSKRVEEDNLRLQICPSLILGGSTVWHLNPNTLGGGGGDNFET
jgi:hypothetical protein